MNPELETLFRLRYGPFQATREWFGQLPEEVLSRLQLDIIPAEAQNLYSQTGRGMKIQMLVSYITIRLKPIEQIRQHVYQALIEHESRT